MKVPPSHPSIFLSPIRSTTYAVIHTGEYIRCLSHWESIHPERQKALLERMKNFIDDQIVIGIDNDYSHISKDDAMGDDISDVSDLFR